MHIDGVEYAQSGQHHRALADDLPDQISERNIDPEDLAFLPSHGSGYPLLKAWLSM
jgi:hypothetical protein